MSRRIVVTSALPYANGAIHIGHLVEYLQTDFWVRFQKMRGNECVYICADDTHGTPIMVRARKEGITPEELISRSHAQHAADFADFEIAFDNYYSTNSPENKEFSESIFVAMQKAGAVRKVPVEQFYCEHDRMFLPDRFVKGICPKCGAAEQYGDSCDACGITYDSSELKEPRCTVCGKPPVRKSSDQLFFELEPFRAFLREWIPEHTDLPVANKLLEWFGEPLRGWNISRDEPYFGFPIPGFPGKYFYVWVDAPVGYMASLKEWCGRNGKVFEEYWESPEAELYHFIGKDIVRFHCLFWPAMLHCSGHKTPTKVFVHGFLTVNGAKMSKTKGTFISARTWLDHLPASALRFYYACKLNGSTDDMDLNLDDDFINRVNSDLVGKITNLASRGAQMLHKNFSGRAGDLDAEGAALLERFREPSRLDAIAQSYEKRDFCSVMVQVRGMADEANRYFDSREPWKLVKVNPEAARGVLTATLNLFRFMAILLKPILPSYVAKVEKLLGEGPYVWSSLGETWSNREVAPYDYLAVRIDPKAVEAVVKASVSNVPSVPAPAFPPVGETVDFETFAKADLRVAKVLSAEAVEGSEKLLKVLLDVGDGRPRQVFAGIRKAYAPEQLVGRSVAFVANLAPRKMRFGVSEGMILAASNPDGRLFVLNPDGGALPGAPIR
ncbi:MAG: methionine--tRNA ligase [Kiritimatiellia bacterium]